MTKIVIPKINQRKRVTGKVQVILLLWLQWMMRNHLFKLILKLLYQISCKHQKREEDLKISKPTRVIFWTKLMVSYIRESNRNSATMVIIWWCKEELITLVVQINKIKISLEVTCNKEIMKSKIKVRVFKTFHLMMD